MKLYKTLVESFDLLKDQPRFFVPRLISTSISTVWFVFILENYLLGFSSMDFSMMQMLFYLASGPLIIFLGIFVSVMLARMVDEGPELKNAFIYTWGRFKSLLAVTVAMLSVSFMISIPFSFGIVLYPLLGIPVLVLSAGLSLLMMLAVSFAIYFLPIALVESTEIVETVKNSVKASRQNSVEVSVMLAFSLLLLVLSALAQGSLETLGYIGFALSRFMSAVVTTYIFVVSPKLYLSQNES